jgi:hypothetical protein
VGDTGSTTFSRVAVCLEDDHVHEAASSANSARDLRTHGPIDSVQWMPSKRSSRKLAPTRSYRSKVATGAPDLPVGSL